MEKMKLNNENIAQASSLAEKTFGEWFSYNGPSFHPLGDEEDLSGRMIKGMSKAIEHKFVDGINHFIISI